MPLYLIVCIMTTLNTSKMTYRNFGNSGLKVSVLSMGKLYNSNPESVEINEQLIKACLENGINHFDTAEIYSEGEAELQLGKMIKKLEIPREDVVISTKVLSAPKPDINSQLVISRKHIREGVKESLDRLQLDYVDVVYAHIYDDFTPLEQVCRGFHEIIEEGWSFYWATSSWSASQVFDALAICEKCNLHKPIGCQNYYNILNREEMQVEYLKLLKNYNYGFIAWSPLASGYLTGKYLDQKAEETARYNLPERAMYRQMFFDPCHNEKNIANLKELTHMAEKLGFRLMQLVLAWTIQYQHLDSVVIGPKNAAQLKDYLRALECISVMTPDLLNKVTKIIDNTPAPRINFRSWEPFSPIRP